MCSTYDQSSSKPYFQFAWNLALLIEGCEWFWVVWILSALIDPTNWWNSVTPDNAKHLAFEKIIIKGQTLLDNPPKSKFQSWKQSIKAWWWLFFTLFSSQVCPHCSLIWSGSPPTKLWDRHKGTFQWGPLRNEGGVEASCQIQKR